MVPLARVVTFEGVSSARVEEMKAEFNNDFRVSAEDEPGREDVRSSGTCCRWPALRRRSDRRRRGRAPRRFR